MREYGDLILFMPMAFWITAALLACAAAAALAWPLLGARIAPDPEAADTGRRLDVYRDRREEIERERKAGRLTEAEAQAAQRELLDEVAARFDGDLADASPHAATPARRRPAVAAAVVLALPVLAFFVYLQVGAPDIDEVAAHAMARAGDSEAQLAEIHAGVARIEARVAEVPDDGEAWAMLGAARKVMGENDRAIPAFERALELLGPHPRLLADLAESIALVHGGRFAGRPIELLGQALALAPRDPRLNGLMGAAQFQAGNMAGAREHLEVLLANIDPQSEQAARIRQLIGDMGGAGSTPAEAGSAPLVAGRVEIDASRLDGLPPGATVFVSARAPAGSRLPFAAIRQPVDRFDGSFALGDAQSMVAGHRLSDAAEVVVEVRISATGDAQPTAGDVFGTSQPVVPGSPDAEKLVVRADQVVP